MHNIVIHQFQVWLKKIQKIKYKKFKEPRLLSKPVLKLVLLVVILNNIVSVDMDNLIKIQP
jgi:hypothetical protein